MEDVFKSNLKAYITRKLEEMSLAYSNESDLRSNFMFYMNRIRRVPLSRQRKIVKSSVFECPLGHMSNFQRFVHLSESGASLLPFSSRGNSKKPYKTKDSLFDDWGIIHFHFVESGTREVIFSIVEPDHIYLLAVYPHGPGHGDVWFKKELIDIIHKEFPFLISHLKLSNSIEPMTITNHMDARKFATNVPIVLDCGSSYYPPGLGIMANKESSHDNMAWMYISREIEAYANYISRNWGRIAYNHGVENKQLGFDLIFNYDLQTQLLSLKCKSNYGVYISL